MTLVKVNNTAGKAFDGFVNDILNDLPANFQKTFREDVFSFPPVNIIENEQAYQLDFAVPGLEKSDFHIHLDGNLLTISADKKLTEKPATDKIVRTEFSFKAFKRSFTLDEKIEAANIEAKYENGILKLILPKKEVVKLASKEINIQ